MRVRVFLGGAPGDVITVLTDVCEELGYEVLACEELICARKIIAEETVDLVCLAHYLQDGTAFELCREMRKQPLWRDCPILLVTERANPALIEKAFAAGFNEAFHLKQKEALRTFVARYGAYHSAISGKVLLVEDSLSQQKIVTAMLEQVGLTVHCCDDVNSALAAYNDAYFDLIITDVVLEGDLTGLDLIARIRRMEDARGDVPIIVMSSYRSSAQRLEPFRIGADDYVSKPLEGDELLVRARRLIESHQLFLQVREQQRSLEKTNRFMTQMLSRVSHECRNSINIVLGVSKILLRKSEFTADQTHKIDTIMNASKHQLSLLNDILDFTKLNSGNIAFNPNDTDVPSLVAESMNLFEYTCEEQGLTLRSSIADNLPEQCFLDARLVKQVLINLLANAVKFTVRGGITVAVETQEGDSGKALVISVRDTGPGIESDELDLLFQEFKQTQSGRDSDSGTGLGLSLCVGFATVMGGSMDVVSKPGVGSEFILKLPV
ncbi:response regulator [Teredinibacter purpureus]|uniref:response regulator n=1 Tax=Teredinibacter purpureus TaxID=2731756 RepID=UPI0005F8343B|nr:response regulator [Teredinibacter purpureus]